MKVCLVGSSGGHLTHLYMLKPFWKDKERFFDDCDRRKQHIRIGFANNIRIPCLTMINAAGHFKETQWRAI